MVATLVWDNVGGQSPRLAMLQYYDRDRWRSLLVPKERIVYMHLWNPWFLASRAVVRGVLAPTLHAVPTPRAVLNMREVVFPLFL